MSYEMGIRKSFSLSDSVKELLTEEERVTLCLELMHYRDLVFKHTPDNPRIVSVDMGTYALSIHPRKRRKIRVCMLREYMLPRE